MEWPKTYNELTGIKNPTISVDACNDVSVAVNNVFDNWLRRHVTVQVDMLMQQKLTNSYYLRQMCVDLVFSLYLDHEDTHISHTNHMLVSYSFCCHSFCDKFIYSPLYSRRHYQSPDPLSHVSIHFIHSETILCNVALSGYILCLSGVCVNTLWLGMWHVEINCRGNVSNGCSLYKVE